MNRKIGPLPLWVWIGTAAAVAAVVYWRARNSGGLATPAEPQLDVAGTAGAGGAIGPGQDLSGILPSDPTLTVPADPPATIATEGTPQGTFTDPGPAASPVDLTGGFADELSGFAQIAQLLGYAPIGTGHAAKPKKKGKKKTKGHHKPPARHAPKRKLPGVKKGHRAPAHPHEHVHHPAPSHGREKPAHTRFNAPGKPAPHHVDHKAPHAPGAAPKPAKPKRTRPQRAPRPRVRTPRLRVPGSPIKRRTPARRHKVHR